MKCIQCRHEIEKETICIKCDTNQVEYIEQNAYNLTFNNIIYFCLNFRKSYVYLEFRELCERFLVDHRPKLSFILNYFTLDLHSEFVRTNVAQGRDLIEKYTKQFGDEHYETLESLFYNIDYKNYFTSMNLRYDIDYYKALDYFYGVGSNVNYSEAIKSMEKSKSVDCNTLKAILYYQGYFYEHNPKKAKQLLLEAAKHGSLKALFYLSYFFKEYNYFTEFYYRARLLSKHDHEYLLLLGKYCLIKNVSTRDVLYYINAASIAHNCDAMTLKTELLIYGKHYKKDEQIAFDLAIECANKFHPEGCFYAGYMFYKGIAVNVDYETAYNFFVKSKDFSEKTVFTLALMYYKGHYVRRDYKKAFDYFVFAHNRNYIQATLNIGVCYLYGNGVNRNQEEGLRYIEYAGKNGSKEAYKLLGDLYFKGEVLEKNVTKAHEYYNLSGNNR